MRGLPASQLRGFLTSLNQRIDAMATAMFEGAVDPTARDERARDEFTSEFTAGLDVTVRGQLARSKRHHHTEW